MPVGHIDFQKKSFPLTDVPQIRLILISGLGAGGSLEKAKVKIIQHNAFIPLSVLV